MKHELWIEPDNCQTFCLAGPQGEAARKLLAPGSERVWEVDADSHFAAMTLYYAYMNWGEYTTCFPEHDRITYKVLGWE